MEETPKVGMCGITNLGNTCYMNSILQLIFHCRPIINFLLEIDGKKEYYNYLLKNIKIKLKKNNVINISQKHIDEEIENTITHQLSKIINIIVYTGSAIINPKSFKKIIDIKLSYFSGYMQHDSQEILLKILDSIYEECGITANIKINNTSNAIKEYSILLEKYNLITNEENKKKVGMDILKLLNENNVEFKKYNGLTFIGKTFEKKYNPVSNDICFFQINTIKCQDCHNETYNYDYTSMLLLDIKNTLYESFNEYALQKLTDENYKCLCCGADKPAYKMCKIYRHSPIMFIQLKRFIFNGDRYVKDNSNMEIPNNINIENFCDADIRENKSKYYNYKLIGFSNHIGSIQGGHYTSDSIDIIKNEWYHFDDERVYKYNNNNVDKSNAYILLYELI